MEMVYWSDSPRLEHRPRNDSSHIDKPSLQIYRNGDEWRIDSREGLYLPRQNLLTLKQQVVMQKTGPQAIRVATEIIRFEPDRDRISIDSPVTLSNRNARIRAETAVFDLEREIYLMQKTSAIYHDDES